MQRGLSWFLTLEHGDMLGHDWVFHKHGCFPPPRLSSQIRIAKLSTLSGRKAWRALSAKGNSKAARLDHGHWNLKPQAIGSGRSLWSRWFGCGWVLLDLAHQSTLSVRVEDYRQKKLRTEPMLCHGQAC